MEYFYNIYTNIYHGMNTSIIYIQIVIMEYFYNIYTNSYNGILL